MENRDSQQTVNLLLNGTVPIDWKITDVVSVFKAGADPLQNKPGIFWLFPEFFLEYDRKDF